ILPVELHIPNRDSKLRGALQSGPRAAEDGPALIILALVTANIRNYEAKLDRMVPYIVELLHDDSATVRSAALRTMIQVLMMVTVITPSNASIFPEYIIPNIKYVVQDPEVSVRCTYAQCIVQLADTAVRYLEMGQALKAHGTFKLSPEAQEYDHARFEHARPAEQHPGAPLALLMDPSSVVKRAVLHDISSMCIFLGRQKTNDVLLSHMITYLNDRDWLLRHAFFESIVDVAACAGGRSLEEYILPLMIQALSDVEETVVAKVLASLTSLCELGLFQKMRIWELMSATLGFLYHPNMWIRQGAAAFISDIVVIDEQSLLTAMKPPLSRQVFDAAVQWAMKAEKSTFWRGQRRITTKTESPRESVVSLRKTGTISRNPKTDEDEAQLSKLQQLGMTSTEETKLLAMRDYILKLANAISSFASRLSFEQEAEKNLKSIGDIELPKLGVTPQTVFLKARSSDFSASRSSRTHMRKTSALGTPLLSPIMGRMDHTGAPFEDLRRRLATINGSSSSIILTPPREPRTALSPIAATPGFPVVGISSPIERPGSPTDSVVSTANSTTFRPLSCPAVGSSKTNAVGHLDGRSKLRSDGSPEPSGRSSPMSMSTTIRGPLRQRVPSLLPISTYDGQEAGISNLLENLYLDNNRELQHDFGPKVHEGPTRLCVSGWHRSTNRGDLVAHLTSHSDAITGLAVSPDHMFFVSASDDKTVKVWDTARLERNVTSKPRHTYGQHHARVKCVCILEGVHCFASAADDGSLHIVRVHITQGGALPKYNKLQVIREHQVEHYLTGEYITCMTHYNTDTASNLNPRHYGPITCLCIDRKRSWIVVGTSTGVLTLWDRRFGLLLKSWHAGVASTGRFVRRGKWVMVAVEASKRTTDRTFTNLVEVWDIEKAVLVETFITRAGEAEALPEPHELTGVDADISPAAAIAALVHSKQSAVDAAGKRPRPSSQSTFQDELLPRRRRISDMADAPDSGHGRRGFMVTGSEDRKLRLWDLSKLERTTVLSGLESEHERPSFSASSSSTASTYVETWPSAANLLKSHQDVVTALACIESPFRGGIVSGDRAGVIKVWRVEPGAT
ncbi:hypothetical protein B0H13DRAFT_2067981, partial [Mycena leptocephala]